MCPFAMPGRPLSVWERALCLVLAVMLAFPLAVATSLNPDPRGFGTHEQLGLPPCTFQNVFHLPCPTCGATTSFARFVRGDWSMALRANAAAFVLAMSLAVACPWLAASAMTGRLHGVASPDWLLIESAILLALLGLSQWLLRLVKAWN
jgi:hypothetical protein